MIARRTFMLIVVLCLLLAGVLAVLVPPAAAEEYGVTEINNNDFWSEKIDDPDEKKEVDMDFEIFVEELNGKNFDIYILELEEFRNYKDKKAFTAKFEMENIDNASQINFTIKSGGPDYYLVVDNRDNFRPGEAYANDTISVDITIERANKDDGIIFCFICGGLIFLAVIAIIVIIVWIIVERKRPPKPFETFEPLRNPPLIKRSKGKK